MRACQVAVSLPVVEKTSNYKNPQHALNLWTSCLDGGTRTSPLHALAFKKRSTAYVQLNQLDKAIPDLEESYRLEPPTTGWDVITLAALYRRSGRAEKALVLLRSMIAEDVGLKGRGTTFGMPTYYHLGLTLNELRQWHEAIEAFTEGLTLQGDYAWAFLERAVAYDAQGNSEQARNDIQRAMELFGHYGPDEADALKPLQSPRFANLLDRYGISPTGLRRSP